MNLDEANGDNDDPIGVYAGCYLEPEVPGLDVGNNVIYMNGVYGQHNVTLFVQIGRGGEYLTADIEIDCPEAPEEEF